MTDILDRPIWSSLSGRHRGFAEGGAQALRYHADHAGFAATPDDTPGSLDALAAIVTPGAVVALFTRTPLDVPPGLVCVHRAELDQMVLATPGPAPAVTARSLTAADVPEMLALVALTNPGPFFARTIELGRYLGVFADGKLAAMAGERMALEGHVEISAVCTHPDHRGHGLAAGLVIRLCEDALARGDRPILHVFRANQAAIALYRRLGFETRAGFHLMVATRPVPPA